MKKRCIAVILLWVIITCFGLHIRSIAYADPFSASQLASAAYGFMAGSGISFGAGGASAVGMNNFMTQQIEDYVNHHGGSLADVFVGQLAVDAAGKLAMTFDMYNSMKNFVDWLKEKYTLSADDFSLCDGFIDGKAIGEYVEGEEGIKDSGLYVIFSSPKTNTSGETFYQRAQLYNGRDLVSTQTHSGNNGWDGTFTVSYNETWVSLLLPYYIISTGVQRGVNSYPIATIGQFPVTDKLSWNGSDYVEPTVLNPDKAWTGTIGGYSEPDTNLDQLLGDIDQAVADNNLVVDGEVIDVPVPPEPVPTWTPVDDVIDGINQQGEILEGIGNDIGDISGHLDDIGEQVDGIEQSLEGVQEGIETQTGVISGAIDQAIQDVTDAIGEQTATLDQTLTETAEGVQDIADALQPGQITTRQFDLRGLFPFCIPFDIHNLLQKFQAAPVAPHVQLPFVIQSIGFSYTFDLDFSAFDSVAAVMRTVEFIVFAIGLAWATSKVIKW